MATAPVSQFSIGDDDRPKKPQQQTAGGFTIGDIGPVTKGPDPAVMAASRARNAQPTDFEKQNGMSNNERQANEFLLGATSGASGLPETMHPLKDAAKAQVVPQSLGDIATHAAKESMGPIPGIIGSIYDTGKQLLTPRGTNESAEDVSERRAHALGTGAGMAIPFIAGEGAEHISPAVTDIAASAVRTPNNTPRLIPRIASKAVLPHWIAGEGLAGEALDKVLPMRTATDTAGRTYTPPNPTQRAALETDAAERTQIMERTHKAEMAKARDIDATNKLNEQAQADTAAKKAEADKQLIREGRAIPITRSPNITPDKLEAYKAGQQQMTPEQAAAAAGPTIPSIITPQTPIEATQFSEGRPATWTNESLPSTIMNREAPMAAKRSAIQQLVLRNRPLPENARYLAGDANFGGVGSNPRSVTLFSPEGTPINSNPSPIIQPIAQRPGAGIPRITDMADDYIRSLGEVHHPEVEHGTELSGPNASGESAVSREALARQASERARGEQRFRIDTRSGKSIPLTSAEDVDAKPGEHDVIVKRGPNGETVIDRGAKANYRPGQKAPPEAARVSTSVENPETYEIGDEETHEEKKKKK